VPADPILNPTVYLGNFEWREPVTTLTDFLVALVCWFAFFQFHKIKGSKSETYPWFKRYFFIFAIGMTSAAWLGHGLQAYVPARAKAFGWMCGATGLMFLQFGSFQLIKETTVAWLKKVLPLWFIVQWLTAISLMVIRLNVSVPDAFMVTQINSTVAIIGTVLPMHFYAFKRVGISGSKIVLGALGYSIIPGIVYSQQLSIHRWFNYHDISHVLMAIFMTIMFLGLRRIVLDANRS
jgi:hypothetical protein